MSNDDPDRNLLFALLALRIEFITYSDFILAICEWEQEPQYPLGALLVRQDAIDSDTRSLLESVVDQHIRKHGDSATRSLVSLGPLDFKISTELQMLGVKLPAELTHVATSVSAAGWIRRHHHWLLSGAVTGVIAVLVAATIVAFARQSRDTTFVMIGLVTVVMIAVLSGLILVGIPYLIARALKDRWNRRFLKNANLRPSDWEKALQLHFGEAMKHMDRGGQLLEKLCDDPGPHPGRLADFTVHFVKSCLLAILIWSVPCTVFGFWQWSRHSEHATFFVVSLVTLLISGTICAILAGPER